MRRRVCVRCAVWRIAVIGMGLVCHKLMHSWGFALREGVFAETKEGICRNKDKKKASSKNSRRARVKVPYSKQGKRLHGAASSWYRDYDTLRLVL